MLIRVKAAGLATTDLLVMLGVLAPFVDHVFPLIPGFDASGVVEKVGPAVVGFAVGDEVFGYRRLAPMGRGTMAVFVALATDTAQHKPSHLKHEQVAVFPHCGLTAQAAVEAAAISDGTSVVILGATGGVGSFATQLAAQAGGHVIGVARGQNHDYARALGAAHAFDYEASDPVAEVRDHYPDGSTR